MLLHWLTNSQELPKAPSNHFRSVRLSSACFGRCPNRKAEGDLVHEVGQVVHQVENTVLDTAHEISEEVAKRVDGPTDRNDETHGLERSFHMLVRIAPCGRAGGFTHENFKQDVSPS